MKSIRETLETAVYMLMIVTIASYDLKASMILILIVTVLSLASDLSKRQAKEKRLTSRPKQ
ncbi:hypothetical protein [Enterococcus songbeiensis]|uniref:hypothetical protein n=1 Tax=Enterococcus songbeiensis TaxID=2559927 RepID=UPI0010F632B4|nr:hypothetical protein [Enterococcus songbeiensis]